MLEFEWLDRASRGWIDSIPQEWFLHEGTHRGREHVLRRRKDSKFAHARCDVTVHPQSAELDYEAHEEFNIEQQLYIGTARIGFADADRSRMATLEWRPKGRKSFKALPFRSAKLVIPDEKEYHLPQAKASQKLSKRRDRPGQAQFRTRLKGAYKHRCCITDCDVSDVLEGAHIDEYRSAASNNLKNGLLLRADIHALFDRNLLAIEPSTHAIHVGFAIRNSTDYAPLHGKKMRFPENPTHYPSRTALETRWKKFIKSNP